MYQTHCTKRCTEHIKESSDPLLHYTCRATTQVQKKSKLSSKWSSSQGISGTSISEENLSDFFYLQNMWKRFYRCCIRNMCFISQCHAFETQSWLFHFWEDIWFSQINHWNDDRGRLLFSTQALNIGILEKWRCQQAIIHFQHRCSKTKWLLKFLLK